MIEIGGVVQAYRARRGTVSASAISVLSAGSIEPGLVAAMDAFNSQGAHEAKITWSTAPAIRKRMDNGEVFDVVIAPVAAVDDFARQHKVVAEEKVYVGRVGIGVVTRGDVETPELSGADALKKVVLDAESVVFNRASSGLYVEALLKKWGIYERIQGKTTRFDDGPAMMAHLIGGKGREIGFGAIIEILMFANQGLKLAGPLPPEVQNWTTYFAVPLRAASHSDGTRSLLGYLASASARGLFAEHGID